jgi:hypothetical protein
MSDDENDPPAVLPASTVARAAALQARGLRLFPVDHPAHPDCLSFTCRSDLADAVKAGKDPAKLKCPPGSHRKRGKHPIGKWTTIAASPMSQQGLLFNFSDRNDPQDPDYRAAPVNIGIACKAAGVLVVDEDQLEAVLRFAESRGQLIDCNYRVRTGKGVHYWFGPPECGTPIGNRSGTLLEHGIDVRGGLGQANNGGYVLAPGSAHVSGETYTELDPWPGKENLRPFPAWLVPEVQAAPGQRPATLLGAAPVPDSRHGATGQGSPGGTVFAPYSSDGWTDDVRYGTREELVLQFERHVIEARACRVERADGSVLRAGAEWRHAFFLAALDGWRLIACGANRGEVDRRLRDAIRHVWDADADAGDEAIVADAKRKAVESPWELYQAEQLGGAPVAADNGRQAPPSLPAVPNEDDTQDSPDVWAGLSSFPVQREETVTERSSPSSPGVSDDVDAGQDDAMPWDGGAGFTLGDAPVDMAEVWSRSFDADVARQLHRRLVDEEAKRRQAAMARAGRRSIAEELIDVTELHKVPKPEMIMAKLLPARQVGFIYGPWGTYKSFVATEMVIALARGCPLFDHAEFAVPKAIKSLYVASEGADGIAERVITSLEQHSREVEGGMLSVYPKPLRLNDPDVVAELALLIEDRGYGFVVIDTYHRSAPGTEENSATEFGLIFEAMAELRDRLGITILFVDHSGKNGDLRGSSAKTGDGEFLLTMTIEGESRKADVQRTLHAEKHKNTGVGDGWNVRLVELPRPDGEEGTLAYLELGDVAPAERLDGSVFDSVKRPDTWFQADIDVPPEVAACSRSGNGRRAVLDVFRVMVYGKSIAGLTKSAIVAGVREAEKSGGLKHGRTTIESGLELLIEADIVEPVEPAKPGGPFRLADRFDQIRQA